MSSPAPNVLTPSRLFSLENRVALVTGAASGLGASMARALAAAGATVALHGNRRPADEVAASLGGRATAFAADLSSPEETTSLFRKVKAHFGRVDVLINNAGTIHREEAINVSLEDWQRVLQVNLTSSFQLAQLAAKDMLERRSGGKIINVASLLSFQGGIRVASYAASKGGIAQLTKALANEWAHAGIQANAIAPGYFATSNTEALRQDPLRQKQILERIPAGRWGEPDDLAGTVIFLASAASNYVNGTVLTVDGGWLGR